MFRKFTKAILNRWLILIGNKFNYFLIKGNLNPNNRFNHSAFMQSAWITSMDLVRNATVEMLSREIYQNGISGAVAELGVYQGEFASVINYHFPDRSFYLFDTFQGFDFRDAILDRRHNYSEARYDFSDTSVDIVLRKLPFKSKAIVKQGWFPESAEGCENETFCFVNLDADLYNPILQGLHWFYPRLAEGGYIIVHDYNNDAYAGVKHAVQDFISTTKISYVALPDTGGSIVIGKSVK
jgi:O-methyltransferase